MKKHAEIGNLGLEEYVRRSIVEPKHPTCGGYMDRHYTVSWKTTVVIRGTVLGHTTESGLVCIPLTSAARRAVGHQDKRNVNDHLAVHRPHAGVKANPVTWMKSRFRRDSGRSLIRFEESTQVIR